MKNSEFIRGQVPITKEEVRAVCLQKLELIDKKNFLDIGTGTGSISVEAGINYPGLNIYSVDKNKKALDLARANIEKFGLNNITLLEGNLPYEGENLEAIGDIMFDAVFVGGASNNIEGLILWLKDMVSKGGVIVANFILVESVTRYVRAIEDFGFGDIEVVQVAVSRMEELGGGHYFKPNNPVFVVSARKVD